MSYRPSFDADLRKLMIVAAVSGAGKSTFIRMLRRRQLPAGAIAALPAGCVDWVAIGKRESYLGQWRSKRGPAAQGQMQECDMTYDWAYADREPQPGEECHFWMREDLKAQIDASEEIWVVIVQAPPGQIIEQLRRRSVMWRVPPSIRQALTPYANALLRLERRIPPKMIAAADRLLGWRWRKHSRIRAAEARLMELYAQPGVLDRIYREFETAIVAACGGRLAGVMTAVPQHDGGFELRAGSHMIAPADTGESGEASAPPQRATTVGSASRNTLRL